MEQRINEIKMIFQAAGIDKLPATEGSRLSWLLLRLSPITKYSSSPKITGS